MSFSIVLQQNKSEHIQVNKELETISTITGVLRESSTIIDPVFLVETSLESVSSVNYITIPEFKRSYFVNNITLVRTGLVEFACHVDVLSSFADEIKSNTGIVRRQEKSGVFNLYLDDGSLKAYANPHVMSLAFPTGFNGASFIFAIAGAAQIE